MEETCVCIFVPKTGKAMKKSLEIWNSHGTNLPKKKRTSSNKERYPAVFAGSAVVQVPCPPVQQEDAGTGQEAVKMPVKIILPFSLYDRALLLMSLSD